MTTADPDAPPPANKGLLVLAGVLLLIPCLALLPVGWYSDAKNPRAHDIAGWPMFVWYQMLWVPLTAMLTSAAYVVVKKARPHVPITSVGRHAASVDPASQEDAQ